MRWSSGWPDSGLTVLLSSHHMDEVEEICDNVTIMSRGTVAFHGSIADLRAMAPDPATCSAPATTRARCVIARDRHPDVMRRRPTRSAGLVVIGPRDQLSAYVADLVRAEVGLLEFTPTQTPLEALFFMLTDTQPDAASHPRPAPIRSDAGAAR